MRNVVNLYEYIDICINQYGIAHMHRNRFTYAHNNIKRLSQIRNLFTYRNIDKKARKRERNYSHILSEGEGRPPDTIRLGSPALRTSH